MGCNCCWFLGFASLLVVLASATAVEQDDRIHESGSGRENAKDSGGSGKAMKERGADLLAEKLHLPEDGDFCFVSFGCWGGFNRKTQAVVAKGLETIASKYSAKFALVAGDNFYKKGVTSAHDTRFQETFEKVYAGPGMSTIPWFVVLGNHDYRGNVSAQIAYTFDTEKNHLKRWYMPQHYYIKQLSKTLLIVMLDCPLMERCANNGEQSPRCWDHGEQKRWLEKILRDNDNEDEFMWKIAVCHYPMFANGPHPNFPWLVSWLQPLLNKHCFTMYINADNHYLQVSQTDGVYYVNSGGGAGFARHMHFHKGYRQNQFSIFERLGDGFFLHCFSSSGTVLTSVAYSEEVKPVYNFTQTLEGELQKCERHNRGQRPGAGNIEKQRHAKGKVNKRSSGKRKPTLEPLETVIVTQLVKRDSGGEEGFWLVKMTGGMLLIALAAVAFVLLRLHRTKKALVA